MFLKKTELFHFRNYEYLSLDFHSLINIFIGDNGQGKSSFLEAVYCALRGKSFHSFVSSQFIQKKQESAKVILNLKEKEGFSKLEARFFCSNLRLKRDLLYCEKKIQASSLIERFPCFVFTESSLKCIRQGSAEKRIFIEEFFTLVSQNQSRIQFDRVLKQKKQLLKDYKKGQIQEPDFLINLQALNKKFLEFSQSLVQARLETLKRLYVSVQEIAPYFFKNPAPALAFSYLIKGKKPLNESSDISALLEEDLNQKKELEIRAGIPLSGPHRHEIQFLFNGEDSRVFCSKGQQRSYILSLLLSHVESFPKAFLLLDDVLLELDENIQEKFLKFLAKKNCQTFLTSCKIISFKTKNMSFFNVKNGKIKEIENGFRKK